jgi:predicted GNAT family acetyltransferase
MIRLLTEDDTRGVLTYLYQESAYNIFPIGDIEAFGFNQDFQRVYAEFDADGNYQSILLRYKVHAIYYAHETRFNVNYLEIFKDDPFNYISGKASLMALIKPYLKAFEESVMYFCEATYAKKVEPNPSIIKVTDKNELETLYDMFKTVEEFPYYKTKKEAFVKDKLDSLKMGTIYAYQLDDGFVSSAMTTATTTKNSMIVSVATHKDFRKKGYASRVMEILMDEYINQFNKSLCLFYDNPDAGKIYHRLGFKTLGMWHMYKRKDE